MGNLKPILIKQGNVKNSLKLFVGVIANISLRTLRLQEVITLLPDPNRVRLDPGEVLQILYGKRVHDYTTISVQKSSVKFYRGRNIITGC